MGMMVPMIMTMVVNLIYTILAIVVAVVAIRLVDDKIFNKIDFQDEIKKGNLSAAIVLAAMVIFIAIVVSSGLKG